MDTPLLADQLLRDLAETLADLATLEGRRDSLERVEDRLFLYTQAALRRRGHSAKVVADMFGFATASSYRRRLRRVLGAREEPPRTLRGALLGAISDGPIAREDLLARFETRDEAVLRSVLRDLVDAGLVSESVDGRYALALGDHLSEEDGSLEELVCVLVSHRGPLSDQALAEELGHGCPALDRLVARLVDEGRITRGSDGRLAGESVAFDMYPATQDDAVLAALVDHHQNASRAIAGVAQKWAGRGSGQAGDADRPVSHRQLPAVLTCTFETWPEHPGDAFARGAWGALIDELSGRFYAHAERGSEGAGPPGHAVQLTVYCGVVEAPLAAGPETDPTD